MRICYYVEVPQKTEPVIGEICRIIDNSTKNIVKTILELDPRRAVPSPPRLKQGLAIHGFEVDLNNLYTVSPTLSPINEFLPWFEALETKGKFEIKYQFVLETFQQEMILMSLALFSKNVEVLTIDNTISFSGAKGFEPSKSEEGGLRENEFKIHLKYS